MRLYFYILLFLTLIVRYNCVRVVVSINIEETYGINIQGAELSIGPIRSRDCLEETDLISHNVKNKAFKVDTLNLINFTKIELDNVKNERLNLSMLRDLKVFKSIGNIFAHTLFPSSIENIYFTNTTFDPFNFNNSYGKLDNLKCLVFQNRKINKIYMVF
jgi:hypothetical protein